jgi:hypothetical protein
VPQCRHCGASKVATNEEVLRQKTADPAQLAAETAHKSDLEYTIRFLIVVCDLGLLYLVFFLGYGLVLTSFPRHYASVITILYMTASGLIVGLFNYGGSLLLTKHAGAKPRSFQRIVGRWVLSGFCVGVIIELNL